MTEIELLNERLNSIDGSVNSLINRVERCFDSIVRTELRLEAIEKAWEGFQGERALLPTNGQARLDGLERMAVDAIGEARQCITEALQRHEDRLAALDESIVRVLNLGVIKYGLTRARRLIKL